MPPPCARLLAAAGVLATCASGALVFTLDADNKTASHYLNRPYLNINIDTGSIYNGFDFMDTALINYVRE